MPRNYLLVLLAITLLSGCGRPPQLNPLPDEAVILAFGDSLTHGTGALPQQSYPAMLEKLLGRKVYNAGVPGEISSAGLQRLAAVLEEVQPNLVIICHGGNDILRKLEHGQTQANLAAMIDLVRQRGAQIVLLAVPTPALFLSPAPFYEELAAEQLVVAELDAITDLLKQRSLKSDQVHLNAKGYAQLAEAVAALLRDRGAIK